MNIFRLNQHRSQRSETSRHRSVHQRLFRPIRGRPRRFVVVQGQVSPPAASTSPNLNQGSQGQDPESLNQASKIKRVRDCNPCLLGCLITMTILTLLFLTFSVVCLITFFYREDISTTEKWEFLTG